MVKYGRIFCAIFYQQNNLAYTTRVDDYITIYNFKKLKFFILYYNAVFDNFYVFINNLLR